MRGQSSARNNAASLVLRSYSRLALWQEPWPIPPRLSGAMPNQPLRQVKLVVRQRAGIWHHLGRETEELHGKRVRQIDN